MGLFERYHLTAADAEKRLKRPLTGDPSRGELAVLAALNVDRFDDARRLLERDPGIKGDFRELMEEHLRRAVPLPVWDEYARQARLAKVPVSEVLAAAVQRDFDRRQEALAPFDVLDETVRAYHRAAGEVLDELRQLQTRLGPLQDFALRLGRIEASLGLAARR